MLLEFGLWGYCLPMPLTLKIVHYPIQGVSPISLGWMWLLLFLLAGLGNGTRIPEIQLERHMHAQTHTSVVSHKKTRQTGNVVMAPT